MSCPISSRAAPAVPVVPPPFAVAAPTATSRGAPAAMRRPPTLISTGTGTGTILVAGCARAVVVRGRLDVHR